MRHGCDGEPLSFRYRVVYVTADRNADGIRRNDWWWSLSLTCHRNRAGLAALAPVIWKKAAWSICDCARERK